MIHFLIHKKNGQSVLEMGILFIVIVAALIVMQVYLKRGIQGRLRSNVDAIGDQYDPVASNSEYDFSRNSSTTTFTSTGFEYRNLESGGPYGTLATDDVLVTQTNIITNYDNTARNGYERVFAP